MLGWISNPLHARRCYSDAGLHHPEILMAAIRSNRRVILAPPRNPVLQRLTWLALALVTGWMAATCLALLGVASGIVAISQVAAATAVGTVAIAFAIYWRFTRLGRIDETLVIVLVVGWTAGLGLISL
jgi:hypothetical protein